MCPTFYGRLFKVFLPFSKHSKMFHLLSLILESPKQKTTTKNKSPAAFPFLFLAKWISAARHWPDNPGDARRLLSSRSQRGSSFGTAARRLQLWPSFQSLQPQQQNHRAPPPRTPPPIYRKELSSASCPAHLNRIHRCLTACHMAKMTRMMKTETKWAPLLNTIHRALQSVPFCTEWQ